MDPTFQGNQFFPGTASYKRANDIYATSTYGVSRDMNPSEILQPASIEDIQNVVKAAAKMRKPLAIRTGGHQYSGASSTGPEGIQLDLKPTFRRPNIDLNILRKNGKVYLRSSVSWQLHEIFDFLKDNGVFMPTGQCSTVCLGGHVQTGGYGMLARSFGLLGDWVRELDIVDYNGEIVKITKDTHPDLFYGFLGGSPGNLGVLTHFKIEVQADENHRGSKGLWQAFHYEEKTLKALLDILVQKGEDPNFPRGYDFTVNILSAQADLLSIFPGTEDELKSKLPDNIHDGKDNIADLLKFKYAVIVVYAQWVNVDGETYSPDLFKQIQSVPCDLFKFKKESQPDEPMSSIATMWLFDKPREFPLPYVKRTNTTNSVELSKTGWSSWFSGRINDVIKDKKNGLWISSQLQVYGGNQSMFRRNAGNGTAYCFRDATFGGTWDVFYQGTKDAAEKWQTGNDEGRAKYFSKEDRRVLWGSYGDWNMKDVWQFYYDPASYQKMQKIRQTYDPNGTFTANPFCVEALE
ncbi:cytokinin dehydrogenase 3 [Fusarium beomiforme]|uniref:Cytokinin dehydrogenase 3 n=1 Tax=Fusarium beomiforme TaxID=44412 RepID=A0A9P5DZF8_9HYPO|nr:cytokinin dehydrogenase 3 [Fusarium beomiforme]